MRHRISALCIVAAVLIAACGGSSSQSGSGQGGTLTVAIGTDADTLDPAAQTTSTIGQMLSMVCEPLVKLTPQNTARSDLATTWSMSPDGLTYTFDLRHDVRFQDGEPFNAEAVKVSLDRLNSPETFDAEPGLLTVIKSVAPVSDYKVQIQLKQPFSPLVLALTGFGIMAPKAFTEDGNTPAKVVHPVGTGPYRFASRVEGEQLVFTRFDGYWGKKPGYEKQVYKVVPNAESREALVKAGQAQAAYEPPPSDIAGLSKNGSGVRIISGPGDRMTGVAINTQDKKNPQLSNPIVRQALNYAVDKQLIIQKVLFGWGKPLDAPIVPGLAGYCPAGSYAYNPQKARQLLQQTGAEGMTLTLASPNGHYLGDYQVAQAVSADLNAVGLHVTIPNPPTWPSYLSQILVPPSQATVDMDLLGLQDSNPASSFNIFQGSQIPPHGVNTDYWSSPQTAALIASGTTATSAQAADRDFCQAGKLVWNAAPWIFIYETVEPFLTTTTVKGIYGNPGGVIVSAFAEPAAR